MAYIVNVHFTNKKDEEKFNKESCQFVTFNVAEWGTTYKTKAVAKMHEKAFLEECADMGLKATTIVYETSLPNHSGYK